VSRDKAGIEPAVLAGELDRYEPDAQRYPDDLYGVRVCALALQAIAAGNYGVGALIVDRDGGTLVEAGNRVFAPVRRSDLHAEMAAINHLEETLPEVDPAQLTLYTSLEPCPMCLSRIMLSGVGRVLYFAPDEQGGMVSRAARLPPVWRSMRPNQTIQQARSGPILIRLAQQIFESNLFRMRQQMLQVRVADALRPDDAALPE
jgi:tRNA(Arg) A34 adenosine deaminase TadA